jgi:arsenate reductase
VAGLSSQSWSEFEHLNIDIVITVCDNAAGETCPAYLNKAIKAHWGLADPVLTHGTEEEVRTAFENTFSALEQRISKMLALPVEQLSDQELSSELNKIGT